MQTGNALLGVWMQPPEELDADLNAWYANEHLAERTALPGFLGARRYRNLTEGPRYIALYELEATSALYTPEYARVKQEPTPLTRKIESGVTTFVRNEY